MLTVALTIGDTPTTFVKGLPHNILIICHVCHVLLCPACNIKPGFVMHLIIFKNPCGHGATTSKGLFLQVLHVFYTNMLLTMCHFYGPHLKHSLNTC